MFNSRGYVIGMSTLKGRSSSLNYAVDADEIMEVVKRTNAVAELAPAAGAIAGSKDAPVAPVATETKPVQQPAPEPFYQNPMFIGGAVVVIILIGIAGFMMSRKKNSPQQMQMPMQHQMPQQQIPQGMPSAPKPTVAAAVHHSTVTGVSGFFAGKTI